VACSQHLGELDAEEEFGLVIKFKGCLSGGELDRPGRDARAELPAITTNGPRVPPVRVSWAGGLGLGSLTARLGVSSISGILAPALFAGVMCSQLASSEHATTKRSLSEIGTSVAVDSVK